MNSGHIFIKACRREPAERTPVWIMRQAGRYLPEYMKIRAKHDFIKMCKTPELAAEVTIQPVDIIGVDAAILFSDILVVPEAMGMKLEMVESKGPVFNEPVRNEKQITDLRSDGVCEDLNYVFDAVKLTKKNLSGKVPLIGFAGSPWTLATYMVEGKGSKNFTWIKSLIYKQPELAHRLLEKLSVVVAGYLLRKIKAGCDAVQIFDTWGGILSPWDFKEFSLKYIGMIVDSLKGENIPVIVFAKGASHSLNKISATGCNVVGVDWTTDIGEARNLIGSRVALQGNLDPAVLFAGEEKIESEVGKILEKYGRGSGHIFNLGHGILPETPVPNVKFFVESVKRQSIKYHK